MRRLARGARTDAGERVWRLRPVVAVVLMLSAVALGFAVGLAARTASRPAARVAAAGAPGGVDRSVRSRDGAVAAAVDYATLLARLFPLPRLQAERVAADAASSAYQQVLVAAVDEQLVPLQEQAARLPGSTVYRQSVLATRVDGYVPARARVSVWVLAMIGQSGQQINPMATFATFSLDLVFQRGAWRLDGTSQRPGPTPLLDGAPQLVDEFDTALQGFVDWRPA